MNCASVILDLDFFLDNDMTSNGVTIQSMIDCE